MARIKIIQIQGSTLAPIVSIMNDTRSAVSHICLGIDDMQLLGNKALVLRAEIYPEKLLMLYEALVLMGIMLNEHSLPDTVTLQQDVEYPLSIQVISFSAATDGRQIIPKIPG